MKKTFIIIVIFLFPLWGLGGLASAQTFNTQWQKCVGGSSDDILLSMAQVNGGGYITAGSTNSNNGDVSGNHGGEDGWLVKYNSSGSIIWSKSYGGTDFDRFLNVINTQDGGFLGVGYTGSNNGDVSGNHGSGDAWVVKVNSAGSIEWQKCYGGNDFEWFNHAIQLPDGYLFSGLTRSNNGDVSGNHGNDDAWALKVNNLGNIEWKKCFGGTGYDSFNLAIGVNNDGFYLLGSTDSNNGDVSGNHGERDAWIIKINNAGTIQWQKCFGGATFDSFSNALQTPEGGFILIGSSNSIDLGITDQDGDAWVVKINNTGTVEWQKTYGGSDSESFTSIIQTPDNYYAIAGITRSNDGDVSGNHGLTDLWVLKINHQGTILWQKCLGGTNDEYYLYISYVSKIISAGNGEYILACNTISNDGDVSGNHGFSDGWLIKFRVTNFNLFPNYPCQDKYERLTSEGCTGTTRWYMNLAGQTPTLISTSPNFDYLVPTNLPVQTPIFFECWCLNILGGQNLIGSGYARVLGVANYNLISPTDDISTTPPLPYNVSHRINAANKIIGNNTNVEYRAEESIKLLPGFQANANVVFKAHIGGCNQ